MAALRPIELSKPPVFIVGCPRSGTSILFDLLRRHPQYGSLDREGHEFWDAYNHPSRRGWSSDALSAADVKPGEKQYLDSSLARVGDGRTPLDKTPKNVLRINYLRALYPHAQVILVIRDGRAIVSSLLEGWRNNRGVSYLLPKPLKLKDHSGRFWNYVLPDGWRSLHGTDLATLCTQQYLVCTDAALRDLHTVNATVRYEDLVANPVDETRTLLDRLGLDESREVEEAARSLPYRPVGSISAPRMYKWRDSADVMKPHFHKIEDQMRRFGYDV